LFDGDQYTSEPGIVHWATSNGESWHEIYSQPSWTAEGHILVETE
jgi:hypothetical protein